MSIHRSPLIVNGTIATGILLIPLTAALWLSGLQFNHDNAWLMEATRRWVSGAELYRDIVEVNPPLIFLENVALSGGTLTKTGYLVGVAVIISTTSLWVSKARGWDQGLAVCLTLVFVGLRDFGQRDHLALIFLIPFLMIGGWCAAVWAFFGVGLKPHFILIPIAFAVAKSAQDRNLTSLWRIDNVVLGSLCLGWLSAVAFLWPRYFSDIVPLARQIYSAFGEPIGPFEFTLSAVCLLVTLLVAIRHKPLVPFAFAGVGAVLCFLAQGRFWSYQLVPAMGLAALSLLMAALRDTGLIRIGLGFAGVGMLAINPAIGVRKYPPRIPSGISTVLFLSENVTSAYPVVFECSTRNASRFPTFWTIPGAWNDEKHQILNSQVAAMNEDIRRERPQVIFEDLRMAKFRRPFSFREWADLRGYREQGRSGEFAIWLRNDLSSSVLHTLPCG